MINHNLANPPAYFYMNQYEFLACPARFERATYALEEIVATGISIYFNSLQGQNATVL